MDFTSYNPIPLVSLSPGIHLLSLQLQLPQTKPKPNKTKKQTSKQKKNLALEAVVQSA